MTSFQDENEPDDGHSDGTVSPSRSLCVCVRKIRGMRLGLHYDPYTGICQLDGVPLNDEVMVRLLYDFEHRTGLRPTRERFWDALQYIARKQPKDTLKERLLNLPSWDGQDRFKDFFATTCGSEPSDYHTQCAQIFFRSAIARAFQPGCQADHCLVLVGPEGIGKSSLLRLLGLGHHIEVFEPFGSTEFLKLLRGHWIIEISELHGFRRSEEERVKGVLTATHDTYRDSYGHLPNTWPRRCVFAASTNTPQFLNGAHGNRRILPVRMTHCDLAVVAAQRDQLWAQALIEVRQHHENWWFQELSLLEKAQAAFLEEDPWLPTIQHYLTLLPQPAQVRIHEIMASSNALNIPPERRGRRELMRIAKILRDLGWTSQHTRAGAVWSPPTPNVP